MTSSADSKFVVLKFGGTSVSTAENWRHILDVIYARLAEGLRPVIIHSALSGVTDLLAALLAATEPAVAQDVLARLRAVHAQLAEALRVELPLPVLQQLDSLEALVVGQRLGAGADDALGAEVMAYGELMATQLGAHWLQSQSVLVSWVDARTALTAERRDLETDTAAVLSATCAYAPDAQLQTAFAALAPVIVSQGFIAKDSAGRTVLLGRGGSDTSGAYFAAKLQACRLEIWTDVPGMFSANPRAVADARLLQHLHYDEAQEIASSGAKVLHPRCILPVKQYGIPLHVYATQRPDLPGTQISAQPLGGHAAQVKAIAIKKGVTLVSMESPGMWHEVGFLADVFQAFKQLGLSVDLVSTSETNVTVSLDPAVNVLSAASLAALKQALSSLCRTEIIGPCAAVSLVGRNIRGILHTFGAALSLFETEHVYLVSQAANDLNFTFVIDEEEGDRLVGQLHDLLIRRNRDDRVLGPTWAEIHLIKPASRLPPWWEVRRTALLALFSERDAAYVYDKKTVCSQARKLVNLSSVSHVHFAMKANPNPDVLRTLSAEGLGFDCVSRGEVEHLLATVPMINRDQIVYTPNFAPRAEYVWALGIGVQVTIDNLYCLKQWPEIFAGKDVFVRIDTGRGYGHHAHVRTAGTYTKFGVPMAEIDEVHRAAASAGARVKGLHAHTGSGNFDVKCWLEVAQALAEVATRFPDVRVLDLGGGLGVPDTLDKEHLDLEELDAVLGAFRGAHPKFELWLEPGRFLVATAGVLLARVTQLKGKGEMRYVGVATGMNSLIRPALYGAHHDIVNLSRFGEPATGTYTVVGPICESADVLGSGRELPDTYEGDVLLIATAGAYGRSMSSHYNLREPAQELFLV
jgi:diaminopimelate decarboxylase/aspartate kinase